MERGWQGLPYSPISDFYKYRFGEKVYKIPVSIVDECPNRVGLKGMKTCIFCDEWGSAARKESLVMNLTEQIETFRRHIGAKFHSRSFLVYFQAYTNSFAKMTFLREQFETALRYPEVKGLVVGTRPDCLSPVLLKTWQEFHERSFVAVELGLQSLFDDDLEFYRRGHSVQDSYKAIEKIKKETSVNLGVHLIFGSPFETEERVVETAHKLNQWPIDNVKLHHLHVLKNTPLAELYHSQEFVPLDRLTYARRVQLFLEHLSPRIYVHRLSAFSSRWDELIAPSWTADKMGTHQLIIDLLRLQKSFQGRFYQPPLEEQHLWQKINRQTQTTEDVMESLKKNLMTRLGSEEKKSPLGQYFMKVLTC